MSPLAAIAAWIILALAGVVLLCVGCWKLSEYEWNKHDTPSSGSGLPPSQYERRKR